MKMDYRQKTTGKYHSKVFLLLHNGHLNSALCVTKSLPKFQ